MKWGVVIFFIFISFVLLAATWYFEETAVVVRDQPVGKTITIESVRLARPGRITVVTSVYGRPSSRMIASSIELPRGTYRSIVLPVGQEHLNEALADDIVRPGDLLYLTLESPRGGAMVRQKGIFGRPLAQGFYLR